MPDRLKIGLAWVLTLALCSLLCISAYGDFQWGIFPTLISSAAR